MNYTHQGLGTPTQTPGTLNYELSPSYIFHTVFYSPCLSQTSDGLLMSQLWNLVCKKTLIRI